MILDALNQLSDSQAFTTNATTVTTNCLDLGDVTPKRQVGSGEPLCIAFFIEAITAAADTFTLQAISATASNLTGSVTVLMRTGVLAAAAIPVGTIVVVPIPPGAPAQRYMGGSAILGAADALTASAFVVPLSFITKLQNYATNIIIA